MQLQQDNDHLTDMVYPDTPPEEVMEQKSAIEEITTWFDEMYQDAKNIVEAMT